MRRAELCKRTYVHWELWEIGRRPSRLGALGLSSVAWAHLPSMRAFSRFLIAHLNTGIEECREVDEPCQPPGGYALRIGMKVATGSAVRKSRMMRLQRPDFSMMSA